VSLPLPTGLSPSAVSSFTDCALAFRYSAIDRLPEPPSAAAVKGTLVHRALERLFSDVPAGRRSEAAAVDMLGVAFDECRAGPDLADLGLDEPGESELLADAEALVRAYFRLEDANRVRAIGLELRLEARIGSLSVRGIIDRLELDDEGGLVVTDYKTGRAPSIRHEGNRLGGVHFYAYLCQEVLGRRPSRVQLLYLRDPVAIVNVPTDQSIRGLQTKASAVWSAVRRACLTEDFRPKPGPLCNYCAFVDRCPAMAGRLAVAGPAGEPVALEVAAEATG